jgi:GH18 family chitinase
MDYVRSAGLAGAMIWDLPGDDAAGSLIHAIASGLAQAAR